MKFRLSTSLISIKHTGLSNTCVLILRELGWHPAIWPNWVCAAEQDMVFKVFRLYRVHTHFCYLASWTGCHFGPETFKRVWRLPLWVVYICVPTFFFPKKSLMPWCLFENLFYPVCKPYESGARFSRDQVTFRVRKEILKSNTVYIVAQLTSQTGQFCFLNW